MLGHFCVPKMKQVAYFTGLCSQQIINLTPHQQIINLMLNHLIWCSWSPQTCSFVVMLKKVRQSSSQGCHRFFSTCWHQVVETSDLHSHLHWMQLLRALLVVGLQASRRA